MEVEAAVAAAVTLTERPARESPERTATAYPRLETAPEESPAWREGKRYEVMLGDSFSTASGSGSGGGGDGSVGGGSGSRRESGGVGEGGDGSRDRNVESGEPRQYVHLKYDFVPGRTNLDAPATLRQKPVTGADGKANRDGQRWAAEVEYESRDSENPGPVLFRGDASRYAEGARARCLLCFASYFACCCCCLYSVNKNDMPFNRFVKLCQGGLLDVPLV